MKSQDANVPRADYPPIAKGPGVLAIVVPVVAGLLWLTAAFQLLVIVPRFEKLFMDFKMKLPLLTEWLIRDAWWGAPAGLAFWTSIGIALCFSRRTRWLGLTLVVVAPLLFNLLVFLGICIPYVELVKAIGDAPPW
jgi:type II secretory pathway component PulF